MNTILNLRKVIAVVSILMIYAPSSCAPAPQVPPTQTTILDTATPPPTATFTPAVIATQISEVSRTAEGTGNVIGLALWNNQPLTKITVELCERFQPSSGCGGKKYVTKTDENGYFVIRNVEPGGYVVVTKIIDTNVYLVYLNADQSQLQPVSAGRDLILDPWNIWKLDLHITFPKNGDSTSNAHPTFKWDPYPDAAYYRIFIAEEKDGAMHSILENEKVNGTEFTPEKSLTTCKYAWLVQAFNDQDTIISEVPPPAYEDAIYLPFFYNTNLPEAC